MKLFNSFKINFLIRNLLNLICFNFIISYIIFIAKFYIRIKVFINFLHNVPHIIIYPYLEIKVRVLFIYASVSSYGIFNISFTDLSSSIRSFCRDPYTSVLDTIRLSIDVTDTNASTGSFGLKSV